MTRSRHGARLVTAVPAFLAAFLLASATTSSLISERLGQGQLPLGPLWTVMLLGAALLVWASVSIENHSVAPIAHGAGAAAAVLLVHGWLVLAEPAAASRLVERPGQFVNDAVFVGAVLIMVWSFRAKDSFSRQLAAVVLLVVLCGYRATASIWHLDPFPGLAVQHFVLTQSLVIAGALLVFETIWSLREGGS